MKTKIKDLKNRFNILSIKCFFMYIVALDKLEQLIYRKNK